MKIREGQSKVDLHRNVHDDASEVDQFGAVGKFQIANVDQTSFSFPFSLASGETYANMGDKTVWVKG